MCREVGPNLVKVLDCGQFDCELSRFYVENKVVRTVAQVYAARVNNISVGASIGIGLYIEKDLFDFLSISAGNRYDLLNIGFANGKFYCNQAYFEGIEGTAFWVVDFDVHSENQIRENPLAEEVGPWRDDPSDDIWVIDGTGAYFFGGGRYHIGFDVISFCEDLDRIFH